MNQTLPEDMLPLTPAVFHILLALADGERHGYSIMQEVDANTDGQVKMGPGTLYGSIKRMLAADLIEETDERPDPALDDQRRRYYQLTPFGRQVAAAEARRIARVVKLAQEKHLLGETFILKVPMLLSRHYKGMKIVGTGFTLSIGAGRTT